MVDRLKFACFWALWTQRSLATYKGFVNPLRHYNASDGSLRFVLQLHDSESTEDLALAVQDFLDHFDEYKARSQQTSPNCENIATWGMVGVFPPWWTRRMYGQPHNEFKRLATPSVGAMSMLARMMVIRMIRSMTMPARATRLVLLWSATRRDVNVTGQPCRMFTLPARR